MGSRPVRLVLGNFDGVHKGHRELISRLVKRAAVGAESSVVVTFDPHPADFFGRGGGLKKIDSPGIKRRLLAALGVTGLLELTFNAELAALSGEDFIQNILEVFPLKEVVVGQDFRFGKERSGSVELLAARGRSHGFEVTVMDAVTINGAVVSSSLVRKLLSEEGDVTSVTAMLERPFSLQGKVIQGNQLGRTIGFPTANVSGISQIIPKIGVYAGRIKVLSERSSGVRPNDFMPCVINIGLRPTVNSGSDIRVEAHVYDAGGQSLDLYGETVELEFTKRLRDEKRFENLEALKAQISKDIENAKV